MTNRPLAMFLSASLTLASGCAEGIDTDLDSGEEAISGNASPVISGVVQLQIPGNARVRTGLLIAPDLVLTSSRWIGASTPAAQIQVTHGLSGSGQVRTGWAVTVNPYLPVAIVQTTQPFTGNVQIWTIDDRAPGDLVGPFAGAALRCVAYATSTDFRTAAQEALRTDGAREIVVGPFLGTSARLDDWDAGAPCFDFGAGTWVGFALSATGAPANETRVFVTSTIRFFVDGMRRVALLRRDQPLPYLIHTLGPAGERMCLDVPWGNPYPHAGLNQYPCHGGPAQRWFLDYSNAGGPGLVNAVTGSCIDVPGGSQQSGQALQMFPCHGGPAQSWQANGGNRLAPLSAPIDWSTWPRRRTLCMSVRGGTSSSSRVIEQASCVAGASHQDWFFASN
jgi:hypothetical protein